MKIKYSQILILLLLSTSMFSQGLFRSSALMNVDNDFHNPVNWVLISGTDPDFDNVPGINDTAEINISDVCVLTADANVKRFVIRAGNGTGSSLTINSGVSLTVSDRFIYNIFGTTPISDLNVDGNLIIGDRMTTNIDRVNSDIDISIGGDGLIDINGTSGNSIFRITRSCPLSSFTNDGTFDNNRPTIFEVRNGNSFTFRNNGTIIGRRNFILRTRSALSSLNFENNGTLDLRRQLTLDARTGADPTQLILDNRFIGSYIEIDRNLVFTNSGGSIAADANPSTIRFNRNGTQSFIGDSKVQYHHLILDGNNIKTLTRGDIPEGNMFGDFTVDGGVTLDMVSRDIHGEGDFILSGICNATGNMDFEGNVTIAGNYASSGSNIDVGGDWVRTGVYSYFSGDNVTFDGGSAQNILSETEFFELTIDNLNGVAAGADVDITGVLDIDDGSFDANGNNVTLISNGAGTAQMDDVGTGSYVGDLIVQRHIPLTDQGWRELHSPVASTSLSDWQDDGVIFSGFPTSDFPSFPFLNAYYYNEANANGDKDNGWVAASNVNTDFTSINNGYRIYMDNVNFDLSVTGEPVQGDVIINMNNDMDGDPEESGWNLIGNPYAATIDWELIDVANKTNIHDWYYIWATDGLVTPQYAAFGGSGPGTHGANGKIAHSQAFWVQGDGGGVPVLTIQEDDKDVSVDEFVKSNDEGDFLRIVLTNAQGLKFDETIIMKEITASDNFVSGEDIPKLFTATDYWDETILFSSYDGVEDMVLSKVSEGNVDVILKTICGDNIHNDQVVMSFENLEQFGTKKCLILEDLHLGVTQDLILNNQYVFNADTSSIGNRFVIHITNSFTEEIFNVSCYGEADGAIELSDLQNTSYVKLYDENMSLISSSNVGQNHLIDDLIEGSYTLEVFGTGCGTDSASFDVIIESPELMVAAFSMDTNYINLAVENGVEFSNESIGALTFDWDMGDGTNYFGVNEPSHAYTTPGNYTVVLSADNDNSSCTQSVSKALEVEANYAEVDLIEAGFLKVFNDSRNFVIDFSNLNIDAEIEISIINSVGQTVYLNSAITSNRSEVSHEEFASGVYLVSATVNSQTYTIKVVK